MHWKEGKADLPSGALKLELNVHCDVCLPQLPVKGAPLEVKRFCSGLRVHFFWFSLKAKCIPYCYICFAAYETDEPSPFSPP